MILGRLGVTAMRETIAMTLFVGGFLWALFCIVMSFRRAQYETTRPWAGLQQRARTRKDGTSYVQTYYSKGPAATKATLDKTYSRLSLIGTGAILLSFFI